MEESGPGALCTNVPRQGEQLRLCRFGIHAGINTQMLAPLFETDFDEPSLRV